MTANEQRQANRSAANTFEDTKIDVKLKLSALWITVNLLYLYVDVYGFYRPGVIEDVIAGRVWELQISQVWLLGVLILMTIPSLMVFLSLTLPAKANRWTNIVVGLFEIVFVIIPAIGDSWAFYLFGSAVEIVLLSLIVWHAWKWRRPEAQSQPANLSVLGKQS